LSINNWDSVFLLTDISQKISSVKLPMNILVSSYMLNFLFLFYSYFILFYFIFALLAFSPNNPVRTTVSFAVTHSRLGVDTSPASDLVSPGLAACQA